MHEIAGIVVQALKITVFVLIMMMVLEYLTVQTKNQWTKTLKKNPFMQILLAALFGIIPGCLGTFVIVSMYIHRSIGFAALVTALIATSGDEAFVMFSMIPNKAFLIMGIILAVAIVVGLILQITLKDPFPVKLSGKHFKYHQDKKECECFQPEKLPEQLLNPKRIVLILFSLLFLAYLIFAPSLHGHAHHLVEEDHHSAWGWEKITFLVVIILGLIMFLSVPSHFVEEHLWGHVIKKHFLKIFLWTLIAFVALHFVSQQLDVKAWIQANIYIVLLVAVLVGIIPESGPHIIFISLFAGGVLPLSILVANSIVQDGHGSLPLLAESGKSFLIAKAVNVFVGLLVGSLMLFVGF
ncbi:MAG: putative manganese transporter [Bacteroidota bacterium]|nr:putative manganese transporter [Bacteroidota bacterium]